MISQFPRFLFFTFLFKKQPHITHCQRLIDFYVPAYLSAGLYFLCLLFFFQYLKTLLTKSVCVFPSAGLPHWKFPFSDSVSHFLTDFCLFTYLINSVADINLLEGKESIFCVLLKWVLYKLCLFEVIITNIFHEIIPLCCSAFGSSYFQKYLQTTVMWKGLEELRIFSCGSPIFRTLLFLFILLLQQRL